MKTLTKPLVALALTALLAGCAGPGYYGYGGVGPYRNTLAGAAIGAAGGALLGHASDDGYGNGALVGGALGAMAGGAAGYALDHRANRGYRHDRQPYDGYGNGRYRERRDYGYPY